MIANSVQFNLPQKYASWEKQRFFIRNISSERTKNERLNSSDFAAIISTLVLTSKRDTRLTYGFVGCHSGLTLRVSRCRQNRVHLPVSSSADTATRLKGSKLRAEYTFGALKWHYQLVHLIKQH